MADIERVVEIKKTLTNEETGEKEETDKVIFSIDRRISDDIAILDVAGEIIGDRRFDLNEAIQGSMDLPNNKGIILNLMKVPMMDSVGLGMLIGAYTYLTRKGTKVVLLNVGRSVRYLLVITKLDQVFEKYDSEYEALESFKPPETAVAL
ncbi:MAG: STAS domain-containing protein [Parcubacteria group bacterium]|nr:STAS domain-containing protein [Parcubacteria group bacterium]